MRKCLFLLLCSGVIAWSFTAHAQTMNQYESLPTFMSSTIKPNVVLVLDNSGSMKIEAYMDDDNAPWWCIWWSDSECVRDNYSGIGRYYGYFESGSMYEYITDDGGYFKEDNISGEWSGHFLNWATMRRVDLARKVLVGGKVGWANRQGEEPYYLLGQNEYADWPVKGFVNDDGLTPSPGNMVVTTDYIPDAECSKLSLSRYAVGGDLEIGRIKVTQSWQTVKFSQTFIEKPVVVAKAFSHACSASEVRINNITTEGFDIIMQEFVSEVCAFQYGQVTFMAVTPGNHTIGDLQLKAGTLDTDTCSIAPAPTFAGILYAAEPGPYFASAPVVFTSVNSYNDATPVVTRFSPINQYVGNVVMQEAEGEDNVHATETIGWVAIARNSGTAGTQDFEVGSISGVTDDLSTINFTSGFHSAPFVLADMQTYTDANTSNLRLRLNNSDYAKIRVQEETTLDAETTHSGEKVGYIAMRMPSYNVKVQVNEEPTGVVQETQDKVRMGLAVYNWDHTRTGNDIYTMPRDEIINGGTLWPGWEWENMAECSSASRTGLGLLQNDTLAVENVGGRDICEVPTHVKAPLENIVRTIEEYPQVWATTPTAETLYEVMNYFKQTPTPYFNQTDARKGAAGAELGGIFDTSDDWDPYFYEGKDPEKPSCAKSFVIVISDGQPIKDFTNTGIWGANDTDIIGAITDLGVPAGVSGTPNDYVDDVAWYMHTQDLRAEADVEGVQTVSTYTILAAFGDDSESGADIYAEASMKDAAIDGGFKDKNGDNLPDTDEWKDSEDGEPENYYFADDGEELQQMMLATITDILKQTASSTAASVLSTSGEAKGVVFQAYFEPAAEGIDEDTEIKWLGYMKALWVDPWGNLREDSYENESLDLDDDGSGDHIIQFIIEDDNSVTVYKYLDGIGDEAPDGVRDECPDFSCYPGKGGECEGNCTAYKATGLNGVIPIWEAGEELAERNASDRTIKTWVDLDNNGEVAATGEYIDFSVANAGKLRPFLRAADVPEAEKIIQFIRGNNITGYRDRQTLVGGTEKTWKLGDIVNSTPTVVGKPAERMDIHYGDESYFKFFHEYSERSIGVYTGANDGMLHAFNGGTFENGGFGGSGGGCGSEGDDLGQENWAYIPYNLLPHLKWLTDPDYTHVAYVDLKPKVTDARIFTDDAKHPGGWGTILMGGMGFGGGEISVTDDFDDNPATADTTRTFRPSYFCLDITDPLTPEMLWEKTHENLGFTTSYPGFVRVADTKGSAEQGKWYSIFGSGPTNYDGTSDQNARLFVLDLLDGSFANLDAGTGDVLSQFKSENADGFMASPVVVDYPVRGSYNYSDDVIYLGENYETLDAATRVAQPGKGRMLRFSTRGGDVVPGSFPYKILPKDWNKGVLSDAFQLSLGVDQPLPPITTPVAVSVDKHSHVWVYFGTGRYFDEIDKSDDSPQYFFGMIDDYLDYDTPGGDDNDQKNGDIDAETTLPAFSNISDIEMSTQGVDISSGLTFDAVLDWIHQKGGWFLALNASGDSGEKVINRPSVFGGMVFFTTFRPESDICGFGGDSYLYALYYETGTAYKKSILGTKEVGSDTVNTKVADLGRGKASEVGIHTNRLGRKSRVKLITQMSSGVVDQRNAFAIDVNARIVGWMQQ